MKDIKTIIAESRTSPREAKNYAKSWITQCYSGSEYSEMLHAIIDGMKEGCKENLKYLEDEKEIADTRILEDILTNLSLSIPYENNRSHEWDEQWISHHLK